MWILYDDGNGLMDFREMRRVRVEPGYYGMWHVVADAKDGGCVNLGAYEGAQAARRVLAKIGKAVAEGCMLFIMPDEEARDDVDPV